MPPVNRVRPPLRVAPRNGSPMNQSILSQFVPVDEAVDDSIHMLLYGKNRIGKTTFACQFPKPLYLCSIEPSKTGGARSVSKVEGVHYKRFSSSEPLVQLGKELRSLPSLPLKTIVIDSATSLEDMILKEICGWDQVSDMLRWGKVSSDQYTERSEKIRDVLRPFLDLSYHVVVICNEKDHNPPEGRKSALTRGIQTESFFSAAMGGGAAKWAQDACDYVCQLYQDKEVTKTIRKIGKPGTPQYKEVETETETGRYVRRLRTQYHPNFAAGFRSSDPDAVPEYIEAPTPEEMYSKLIRIINGEKLEE